MELQAIREKLQLLQAEPPAAETIAIPWSEPRRETRSSTRPKPPVNQSSANRVTEHRTERPTDRLTEQKAELTATTAQLNLAATAQAEPQSPQAVALEMLRQRSRSNDPAASARTDSLIAQEIYRLEVQANQVNERSRQQADDIMTLKRSAQQAAIGLRRHGVHDHPQLAVITQFLESYESAAVPRIEKDDQGHFTLTYDSIDFHRAEQDALATAQALRNRRHSAQAIPDSASAAGRNDFERSAIAAVSGVGDGIEGDRHRPKRRHSSAFKATLNWLKVAFGGGSAGGVGGINSAASGLNQLLEQFSSQRLSSQRLSSQQSQHSSLVTEGLVTEGFDVPFGEGLLATGDKGEEGILHSAADFSVESRSKSSRRSSYHSSPFSWLDGTIWFSGAAIARIVVQSVAVSYPLVQTASLIALVGVIIFALYRVVMSKSNNYDLVYRLCVGMMGLFSAGLF